MGKPKTIEFVLLTYVPTAATKASIPMAAIFFDLSDFETGFCTLRLARDWRKSVRAIDPHPDLRMLKACLIDISTRLASKDQRQEMLAQLEDSFSNVIQVSARAICPAAFGSEHIELFARQILNETSETNHHIPSDLLSRTEAA